MLNFSTELFRIYNTLIGNGSIYMKDILIWDQALNSSKLLSKTSIAFEEKYNMPSKPGMFPLSNDILQKDNKCNGGKNYGKQKNHY